MLERLWRHLPPFRAHPLDQAALITSREFQRLDRLAEEGRNGRSGSLAGFEADLHRIGTRQRQDHPRFFDGICAGHVIVVDPSILDVAAHELESHLVPDGARLALSNPATLAQLYLRRLEQLEYDDPRGDQLTRQETMGRLGRILLDHPALMSPALLFVTGDKYSRHWAPMAHALAFLGNVPLPSATLLGFGEDEVARFATHALVRAALSHPCRATHPNASVVSARDWASRQVFEGMRFGDGRLFGNQHVCDLLAGDHAIVSGDMIRRSNRAAFLLSALELDHASRLQARRPALAMQMTSGSNAGPGLLGKLREAFYDIHLGYGGQTFVSADHFSLFLRKTPSWKAQLEAEIAQHLNGDFFGRASYGLGEDAFRASRQPAEERFSAGEMRERTEQMLSALVQCGFAQDEHAAAQWLGSWSVGKQWAGNPFGGPHITMDEAMAFADVIYSHGGRLDHGRGEGAALTVNQCLSTWHQVIGMYEARASMSAVLSAHVPVTQAATASRARRSAL